MKKIFIEWLAIKMTLNMIFRLIKLRGDLSPLKVLVNKYEFDLLDEGVVYCTYYQYQRHFCKRIDKIVDSLL